MEHRARRAMDHMARLAHGRTSRLCPICGYEGMFSPVKHKPETWCPGCDSRPRHRLLKLWMDREMRLAPGARVVHFAAENWVRAEMETRGAHYQTADLNDLFELQLDITAMDLADGSVDMLIANHVLEHVDDARAFAEIHRVLAPGGQAVVTVPMIEGFDETYRRPRADNPRRTRAALWRCGPPALVRSATCGHGSRHPGLTSQSSRRLNPMPPAMRCSEARKSLSG